MIALDPGESTGYCVWKAPGEVEVFGTITNVPEVSHTPAPYDPVRYLRDALRSLRTDWQCEIVIVERLPDRLSKKMQAIVATVNEIFPVSDHHYARHDISPGEWKPMTGKIPMPFVAKTQHEKDAYRVGSFWQLKMGLVTHRELT